jgi:hypothetical protein
MIHKEEHMQCTEEITRVVVSTEQRTKIKGRLNHIDLSAVRDVGRTK